VRFRKNVLEIIVNGSLPLHRKKYNTQVRLEQNQRYEQHETRGSPYEAEFATCVQFGFKQRWDSSETVVS